jgi:hypothetical protein
MDEVLVIRVLACVDVRFHPRPFNLRKPKANINCYRIDYLEMAYSIFIFISSGT